MKLPFAPGPFKETHLSISGLTLLCMAFTIVFALPAEADTSYTYTGNPLTLDLGLSSNIHFLPYCPEGSPCGYLLIEFTVAQPLAPNLFDAHISPTFFAGTFNDTYNSLGTVEVDPMDAPGLQGGFVITIDSSGNITNWGVNLTVPGTFIFFTNNGEDFFETSETGVGSALADNAGTAGGWTMSTSGSTGGSGSSGGGTSVPEPSSVLLLAGGLLGLGFGRRPKVRRRGLRKELGEDL